MPRNNFKTRNFMLELYPDNVKHQAAFDFICSSDWTYCYILHHIVDLEGKDIMEGDGKPHYHMILCFENPVFASALAKKLGLVSDLGEPDLQFIQACRSLDDSLLYLTHVKYQDKEQYSQYDIKGSKILKNRYMSALFKYIEGKRVTVRDFFYALQSWLDKSNYIIDTRSYVGWLCSGCYIKFRNERLAWNMIQDHNEKFYSYMHRDLLSEYARGQIELNRVSGSDCSFREISDKELLEMGFDYESD